MAEIAAAESSWEVVERLADAGDGAAIHAYLDELPPGEAARAMSRLDGATQQAVLVLLGPESAARLIDDMAAVQAAGMIEELDPSAAAAILEEMPAADRADLLAELDDGAVEAILAAMAPAEASEARALAEYPPDVAGGLMAPEVLAFDAATTVDEVIAELRRSADVYADYQVQYLYVVTGDRRLVGVVPIRDVLLGRPRRRLADTMIPEPVAVRDSDSLDALADLFESYSFLGVPVVDAAGRLLGLLQRSDVDEALAERADADYRKAHGIVTEELRTMPLLLRSRRRLGWLSINVLLNLVSASVIAFYQETLAAVIALAAFLPIISDMSGCSGSQAVAVSMRELALGLVEPRDVRRVWAKEIGLGALNGLALGGLVGGLAWLWQGNAWLGLVVGVALGANTVLAVSLGGTIPLLLKRFGVDPALASGPVLTTVTDLCGFFLALGMAAALLPRLVGV